MTQTNIPLKQKIANIKNEIGVMSKDKSNPFFKSKYFDINQILEHLKPLEEKHKISFTQPLTNVNGVGAIMLRVIDLESSDTEEYITTLPVNIDPQKMGATITYYRRYCFVSYLGIQAEDDDANSSSGTNTQTRAKVAPTAPTKPSEPVVMTPFTSAVAKIKGASNIGELTLIEDKINASTILTKEEKEQLSVIIGDTASMM